MIFSSSCPASWLPKRFEVAIWVFLCQLLPLCHLVKAPNPWCGEQGFWWLTWPPCSLVGSSTASPQPLTPHPLTAPPPSGEHPPLPLQRQHLCDLASALPRPTRGHPCGGPAQHPWGSRFLASFIQSRPGASLHFRARFRGLSVSIVRFPQLTEPCLPSPEGTEVPVCVAPFQTLSSLEGPVCAVQRKALHTAELSGCLNYIECRGRRWRFIFRIAVLKLACKIL